MVLRHTVQAEVHQRDVRVVVDPPDVLAPGAAGVLALAVRLPVGDAVDAVGERLLRRALQPAPDEVLDVVVERVHLALHRHLRVLRGQERGLAEAGIVARDRVDAPAADAVVVVGAQHHVRVHRPLGQQAVVPERGIARLMRRDERRALRHQRLERLRAEELEVHAPVVAEAHRQPVLAELREAHLPDLGVTAATDAAQCGLCGVLGVDTVDALVRAQCDARREIARYGHARRDMHVDEPLLDQDLTRVVVVVRPAQRECVRPLGPGRQRQARVGLPPLAAALRRDRARGRGVHEHAVSALRLPVLEPRARIRHDHQVRPHVVGPRPEQERAVPGDETVLEHGRRRALLPARAAVQVDRQRDREVADFERLTGRIAHGDPPGDGLLRHREADVDLGRRLISRARDAEGVLQPVRARARRAPGRLARGAQVLPVISAATEAEGDVAQASVRRDVLGVDGVALVFQAGDDALIERDAERGGGRMWRFAGP